MSSCLVLLYLCLEGNSCLSCLPHNPSILSLLQLASFYSFPLHFQLFTNLNGLVGSYKGCRTVRSKRSRSIQLILPGVQKLSKRKSCRNQESKF